MYGSLALQLSSAHSHKSQRLLARSRETLSDLRSAVIRSESNLAKSQDLLAQPRPAEAGRHFTSPDQPRR